MSERKILPPEEETKLTQGRPQEKPKKAKKPRKFKVSPFNKHVSNCVHEEVVFENGLYVYKKWLFRATDYSCGSCGNTRETVFMRTAPLNIVIQSCRTCGTTTPAEPKRPNGSDQAYALETKTVTMREAKEILLRNKCKAKYLSPELKRCLQASAKPKVTLEELSGLGLEEE